MHDAYELGQLLKHTVQIEAIAAYKDNLLVGTKQGHLLMYSVCYKEAENKHDVQLLRYNKTFSKKPIQQLAVIPEYDLLISLTDNVVCVHDITIINFPSLFPLQRSRGATLFTLHTQKETSLTGETSLTVRLCVAVKRRLQLYYWKNGQFHKLTEDLVVPDVPRALAWCQETLCIGYKGDYSLIDLDRKQRELFPTGKHQEPLITKLSESTFALGKDAQSIFMNTEGNPIQKYAVKWSDVPIAVTYDEPYLLALLPEALEVRTIEPCLYIQSMETASKARLMATAQPEGRVYVASAFHVWLLRPIPVERQVRTLLRERQFQLALRLTAVAPGATDEERRRSLREIQKLYALDLFQNKLFHEAMKEFLKLEIDPYEVIRLFPDLLPQAARPGGQDPHSAPDTRPKQLERDLENGLLALIEFLTEVRHKLMGDGKDRKSSANISSRNSNNNSMVMTSNGDMVRDSDSSGYGSGSGSGSGKSVRDRGAQQLLQIIDTTLLKCYLQTNDALVAPLLRLNHCHLTETEKTLKRHQKWSELIILYQTKGLHKKALELLQKQADQPDSPLFGHERTLHYLQHLGKGHMGLIFEFCGWVLRRAPEDGLKVFTEDVLEVEQLPRPRVLDFLLREHKQLVIPYLEHVVEVWEDRNAIFHNALVHQYRERVLELRGSEPGLEGAKAEASRKLLHFLETSAHYTPEAVIVHFPYDCLYEERAVVVGKLGHHEKALSIYVSILTNVPRAIQYCDKVYNEKSQGYEDVYVLLMRMLISPPENWLLGAPPPPTVQPDLETALGLLEQFAPRIPPVKALSVLPDKVPLSRLRRFLQLCLQRQVGARRRTQVLKGLALAEHLQLQEQRVQLESRSILVTEFNVCAVCRKRFGNQSAFARYPNGDIVHYSCQDRRP